MAYDPSKFYQTLQQYAPPVEASTPTPTEQPPGERPSLVGTVGRGVSQSLLGTWSLITEAFPGWLNQLAGNEQEAARLYQAYNEMQNKFSEANALGQIPQEFENIKSVDDASRYIAYWLGYGAGQLPLMAAGGVGGAVAGGAARSVAARAVGRTAAERAAATAAGRSVGMQAGLGASTILPNIGESATGVYEAGGQDQEAALLAGAAGVAKGLLDYAPIARLLGRSGITREVLETGVTRSLLGRMGREIALNVPIEGATEGLQEAIDAAVESAYKEGFWSLETVSRIANSALAGAIGSVPAGAVAGGVQHYNSTRNRPAPEVAPQEPIEQPPVNNIETPDHARRFLAWRGIRLPYEITDEKLVALAQKEEEAWRTQVYNRQDTDALSQLYADPKKLYTDLLNKEIDTTGFKFSDVLEALEIDPENASAAGALRRQFNVAVDEGFFQKAGGKGRDTRFRLGALDRTYGRDISGTEAGIGTDTSGSLGTQRLVQQKIQELTTKMGRIDPQRDEKTNQPTNPEFVQLKDELDNLLLKNPALSELTEEQLTANQILSALSKPDAEQPKAIQTLLDSFEKSPDKKRLTNLVKQIVSEEAGLRKEQQRVEPNSVEAIELRNRRAALRDQLEGLRDGTFAQGGEEGNIVATAAVPRNEPNIFAVEVEFRQPAWLKYLDAITEKSQQDKAKNLQDYKERLAQKNSRALALYFGYKSPKAPKIGNDFFNYLVTNPEFSKLSKEKKDAIVERMRDAGYVDENGKWLGLWDQPADTTSELIAAAQEATRAQPQELPYQPIGTPLPENFDQTLSVPPGVRDYISSLKPGQPIRVGELQARWKQEAAGRTVRMSEVTEYLRRLQQETNRGAVRYVGEKWLRGPLAEWPIGWNQRGEEGPEGSTLPAFQSNLKSPKAALDQSVPRNLLDKMLKGLNTRVEFRDALRVGDFPSLVNHMINHYGLSRSQAEAVAIGGLWNRDQNLIRLSLESGSELPELAFHEGFHALESFGVFTPQDMALLRREFPTTKKWFESGHPLKWDSLPDKEKRAYTAQRLYAQRQEQPNTIANKIANFLQRLANWFLGMGFQTIEDLHKAIESGEIAQRAINSKIWPGDLDGRIEPTLKNDDLAFMKAKQEVEENVRYIEREQPSFSLWRKWGHSLSHLAEVYPALKPFQQLMDRSRGLFSELMNTSYVEASKLMAFTPERRAAITRLMVEADRQQKDLQVVNGQIRMGSETLTDPKEIEAVMALQDQFKRLHETAVNALVKNAFGIDPTDPATRKHIGWSRANAYKNQLMKERRQGYIPHVRIGNHYAVVKEGDKVLEYVTFDKKGPFAAVDPERRTLDYLKQKYPDKVITVGQRTIDQERRELLQDASVVEQFIQLMVDRNNKNLNDQAQRQIDEMLKKLRDQKEKAFANVFRKRRLDTPGWLLPWNQDTYFEDALPRYFNGAAKAIVRLNTNTPFNNLINGYIDPTTKLKVKGLQQINPEMAKFARENYDYAMAPATPWAASAKSVAFHWQLGFALDSAVVNSLQTVTSTVPYLSMFTNPINAAAQVARAMKGGLTKSWSWSLSKGFTDYQKLVDKIKKENPTLAKYILFLAESGLLSPIYGDEIRNQVDLSRYGYSKGAENTINKVLEMSSSFFSYIEQNNRITAALAAYEILQNPKTMEKFNAYHEKKGWTVDPKQYEDPMLRALAETIVRTQFTGAEYDKPKFTTHKPILQVMTQFMPVMIKMTENYWKNVVDVVKDPQVRVAAGRMLLMQTVAVVAVAGMLGLPLIPLMAMLYDLARSMATDIGHDFTVDLRDFLNMHTNPKFTQAMMKGLPATQFFGGFAVGDLSTRADLNIIRPQQLMNFDLTDALGPAGSSVLNPFMNIGTAYKEGRTDWWNLGAAILPRALGNTMRAYGYSQEGIRTQAGAPLVGPDQVRPDTIVQRSIGITSGQESEARRMNNEVRFFNTRNKVAKEKATEEITMLFFNSLREQDAEKAKQLNDRAVYLMQMYADRDRSEEDPSMRLLIRPETIRQRLKEMMFAGTPQGTQRRLDRPLRGETFERYFQ